MAALRHLLMVVVIGVVFRWLWKSSLNEHASVEAGRTVFPPTRAIRILAVFFGVAFTSLFLWSWMGREKNIRWEDVASLRYNTGNKQFTVCANDGRKITHAGFNAEPGLFQHEIQKRTRLAMKITRPGTWNSETIEVPYEEVET